MGFLTEFWRKWYYNRSNGEDGAVLGAMGRKVRQRYTGKREEEGITLKAKARSALRWNGCYVFCPLHVDTGSVELSGLGQIRPLCLTSLLGKIRGLS